MSDFERMMASIKVIPYLPHKPPYHSSNQTVLSVTKRPAEDDGLDSRLAVLTSRLVRESLLGPDQERSQLQSPNPFFTNIQLPYLIVQVHLTRPKISPPIPMLLYDENVQESRPTRPKGNYGDGGCRKLVVHLPSYAQWHPQEMTRQC